jgi:hypothetical protein
MMIQKLIKNILLHSCTLIFHGTFTWNRLWYSRSTKVHGYIHVMGSQWWRHRHEILYWPSTDNDDVIIKCVYVPASNNDVRSTFDRVGRKFRLTPRHRTYPRQKKYTRMMYNENNVLDLSEQIWIVCLICFLCLPISYVSNFDLIRSAISCDIKRRTITTWR